MKLLQFTFILFLVLSLFNISSIDIVEETPKELSEITAQENSLDEESSDTSLDVATPFSIVSQLKTEAFFSFQIQNTLHYHNSIDRPPIFHS